MITNVNISKKKIGEFSIPAIGLGTHNLTGKDCIDTVIKALLHGYRHIDTAQTYNNETDIGQAIKDLGMPRKDLVITDKIWFDKLKYKDLKNSFHRSLDNLQTDYIDLILIHWPPGNDPGQLREAFQAMRELKNKGYIREIGASNFPAKLITEVLKNETVIANQIEYHPFLDQHNLIELSITNNFFIIAYAPLAQGKVTDNNILARIGRKYNKSEAQVTLRWLIQQSNVIAIPRSSRFDHIRSNIDIYDFELSESEMKAISNLSSGMRLIDPPYAPEWDN